jgi:hypothetical protein
VGDGLRYLVGVAGGEEYGVAPCFDAEVLVELDVGECGHAYARLVAGALMQFGFRRIAGVRH